MKNQSPNINSNFPPGYRFHPTEDELITFYLARKVAKLPFPVDVIPQINLYDYAPWQLPALSNFNLTEKEWFFFNLVDRKFSTASIKNGRVLKTKRLTPEGYWKAGGKERAILINGKIVGWKKFLTFHAGTYRDRKKTDWIMHEYRRAEDDYINSKGGFLVVSRVYEKNRLAQLQMEPNAVHIVVNEGDDPEQDIVLDMALDREASLDVERDMYTEKLEQVSTKEISKVGQSNLNNESSFSKSNTSSRRVSVPGFRFDPTDCELVDYYLKRKVSNLPIYDDAVPEIDLYKWAPWNLPSQSCRNLRNMEWYFFNFHDQKYTASSSFNANRQAVKGYWKLAGNDIPVFRTDTDAIIGMKKCMIFHKGKPPCGLKTDWVMHEYHLKEVNQIGPLCVVSKICETRISSMCKKLTVSETYEKELENNLNNSTKEDEVPTYKSTCALVFDVDAAKGDNIVHSSIGTKQDKPVTLQFLGESSTVQSYATDPTHECKVQDSKMIPLKGHGKPDPSTKKGTRTLYTVGSQAEVTYIRENLPVAWYTATVTEIISENVLSVEYLSLRNEDGALLCETVSTQYIRPRPPSTLEVRNFQLLDEVEAFCNGGWWQGVVADVKSRSKYNVKLMHLEDEIEFSNTELRLLYDWIDGEWIRTSEDKSLESQNNVEPLHGCSSLHKRKDPDLVSTLTSNINIPDSLPSCPQNKTNKESSTQFIGGKKLRKSETTDNTTKLVDSRGAGTSNAKLGFEVPTSIFGEQQLNIHFTTTVEKAKPDRQQMGVLPELDRGGNQDKSLEPQNVVESLHACSSMHKHKDPDSVTTSMSNVDISCLLPSSPQNINDYEPGKPSFGSKKAKKTKMSDDNRQSFDSRCTGTSNALKLGFEIHATIAEEEQAKVHIESIVEKTYEDNQQIEELPELDQDRFEWGSQNNCKPSTLRIVEPVSEDNNVSPLAIDAQSSDNGVEPLEASNSNAMAASSCNTSLIDLSASSEQSTKNNALVEKLSSPCFKRSPMWAQLDSMNVFCTVPQQPHFQPLQTYCKELCEGMAIGLKVTFSNLVNNIKNLEITDPTVKFDEIMNKLKHLEEHGFDVHTLHNQVVELKTVKSNEEQLLKEKAALVIQRKEKEKKREQMLNELVESIKKCTSGLEQSLSQLYDAGKSISEQELEYRSKLDKLKLETRRAEDALLSAELDIEETYFAKR